MADGKFHKSPFFEKELALLVAAGILYFFRPLFLDETLFFRDLYSHFLPQKKFFAETIRSGQLPLWNPFIQGGQPFIANLNNLPLYPSNLIYLLFPLVRAFNWDVIFHVIGSAAGAYLFARRLVLKPVAAMVSGSAFGYCGYTLSQLTGLNHLVAEFYIPLLFLCWHQFLSNKGKKWFVVSVILGVFQFLAGSPEVSTITFLCLLGWSIFVADRLTTVSRRLKFWVLLVVFVLGLSSFQILPLAEMVRGSLRGQGISYEEVTRWSFHLKRLPEFVVPGFVGKSISLDPRDFWGQNIENEKELFNLSIYFGPMIMLLAVYGGIVRARDPEMRNTTWVLIALFFGSLLISMGKYLPLFHQVYEYFPPVRFFRFPQKFLVAGLLPVALLAGFGTQSIIEKPPPRMLVISCWLTSAFLLLIWVGLAFQPFASGLMHFFFERGYDSYIAMLLRSSFFHSAAVACLGGIVLQYRRMHVRSAQPWMLAILIFLDLFVAGADLNPTAPSTMFEKDPPIVTTVRNSIDSGRLFRYETRPTVHLQAPTKEMFWWARWDLQTLRLYMGAFYGIPVIFHQDLASMTQLRIVELRELLKLRLSLDQRLNLLSAGNVTLILTNEDIDQPAIKKLAIVRNPSDMLFYLYRNTNTPARIHFVSNLIFVKSGQEALRLMLSPQFNATKTAILENGKTGRTTLQCDKAVVRELERSYTSVTASVNTSCEGELVFSETYYPGWETYVDNKRVPSHRANFAFTSIHLTPGGHQVRRSYVPRSLIAGLVTSAITAALIYFIPLSPRNRKVHS